MKAIPWKLYSRRELDDIAASLLPRAQAWGKAWLPDIAIGLEVGRDGGCDGAQPLMVLQDASTQSPCAVLHAKAVPTALLAAAAAALGASAPSSGAVGSGTAALRDLMLAHALRDLLARLMGLPSGSERNQQLFRDRPVAMPQSARFGAALWLTLRIGHEAMSVWFAQAPGAQGTAVRAGPKRHSLAPRLEALHSRRIRLRVVAGEASLPLSELMRLGHGDVVLLDRGVDAAMTLESMDGARLVRGYLGLRGNRPVLQLEAETGIHQRGKGQA